MTKARPSDANRTAVGSVRPDHTTRSRNPGCSTAAAATACEAGTRSVEASVAGGDHGGMLIATPASRASANRSRRWPIALEAQLAPDRLQAGNHVLDVLVERHAQLGRALLELVARHLPGEALVLHLLGHGS